MAGQKRETLVTVPGGSTRNRFLNPAGDAARGAKIGVLTFSDGREFVHRDLIEMNNGFQDRLRHRLAADGHEVATGEIVWSAETARTQARRLAQQGCDA